MADLGRFRVHRAGGLEASRRPSPEPGSIPDAEYLLRRNLRPRATHHAKGLLLDREPRHQPPFGLLVGSTNLTVSALHDNFEYVVLSLWTGSQRGGAKLHLEAARKQAVHFDAVWRGADELDRRLLDRYTTARKRVRQRRPWPDPERSRAVRNVSSRRASSLELAAALRAASHFWIETGNMYRNLSGGRSNQLDMKAGSRVFFGFPNRRLTPETQIGSVQLAHRSYPAESRNIWYGDNSMDKLYLPPPGAPGAPSTYVNEVLLFERRRDGSFRFRVGTRPEVASWKRRSRRARTAYRMASGRAFGVF